MKLRTSRETPEWVTPRTSDPNGPAGSCATTRRMQGDVPWIEPCWLNRPGTGGGSDPAGGMKGMAAPRKYPDEPRKRATRIPMDARWDPATRSGTFRRVGEQLEINPETLRNWVVQAEIDERH